MSPQQKQPQLHHHHEETDLTSTASADEVTPHQSPQHGGHSSRVTVSSSSSSPDSPTSVFQLPPPPLTSGKVLCPPGKTGTGTMNDYLHLVAHDLQVSAAASSSSSSSSIAPGSRIACATACLVGFPFMLYRSIPANGILEAIYFLYGTWDGLMHISSLIVAAICLTSALYFGQGVMNPPAPPGTVTEDQLPAHHHSSSSVSKPSSPSAAAAVKPFKCSSPPTRLDRIRYCFLHTPDGLAFITAFCIGAPISALGSMPMLTPSWLWYPFSWFGNYRVYWPPENANALEGICIDQPMRQVHLPRRSLVPSLSLSSVFPTANLDNSLSTSVVGKMMASLTGATPEDAEARRRHLPLCLEESSWDTLSSGALSSYNKHDVRGVMQGIEYAGLESNGLAIAVLARDINADIAAFRANVESIQPFFPNLAVVIFENDSSDGSRESIQAWAQETDPSTSGYKVDLMECPEAENCKLGKLHRDHNNGHYTTSKAIGDMDVFRQRITDYITDSPTYENFSHMLVVDIDLAVSMSPFGLLHTLGTHPENPVACSGHQLFPMSFGSISTPYDFSAFVPWATEDNNFFLGMHEQWCSIMPPGHRWRNSCAAVSPFLFPESIRADRGLTASAEDHEDYYRVQSAFNGAVMYPLDLVRTSQATYDAGEDGQRCEHIGFNLGLQRHDKPMLVNRRWDMHVDPVRMGGPTGWRAKNAIDGIVGNPRIFGMMALCQIPSYYIFIHSMVMLGLFLVYPLMAPLMAGSKSVRRLVSSHHRKLRKMKTEGRLHEETLFKLV